MSANWRPHSRTIHSVLIQKIPSPSGGSGKFPAGSRQNRFRAIFRATAGRTLGHPLGHESTAGEIRARQRQRQRDERNHGGQRAVERNAAQQRWRRRHGGPEPLQVTVHLPGSTGASDWTGEVVGPPQLFVLKTVNVMAAGKTVIVLDKSNKKLWQAALTYPVAAGGGGCSAKPRSLAKARARSTATRFTFLIRRC